MSDDLKLYKLLTEENFVEEMGWINDKTFAVWIGYYNLEEFMTELEKQLNYDLSEGYNCTLLRGRVYIELNELLDEDFDLKEIFP